MTLTPLERDAAREWAYEFAGKDKASARAALWLRELMAEVTDLERRLAEELAKADGLRRDLENERELWVIAQDKITLLEGMLRA